MRREAVYMIELGTCLFLSFTAHKSVSMVFVFFSLISLISSIILTFRILPCTLLYLLGFLFLAGWPGVYECLVCLYITYTRFRLCMICDYIFPYIFFFFVFYLSVFFFFLNPFLVFFFSFFFFFNFLLGYSGTK